MAYRTGTYFAFDGQGQTNPAKSDFKYYATVKAWSSGKHIDFNYVDSHEKTSAVRDSSKMETLKTRIRERLAASKNIVVILSADTRDTGSMLSYEIEKAVDTYKIPLLITYTGYNSIMAPAELYEMWPDALRSRINSGAAKAIHLPFKKAVLLDAIEQFSVNKKLPTGSLDYYTRDTHVQWGYVQ